MNEWFEDIKAALMRRPPGAVVRVWHRFCALDNFRLSQLPEKPSTSQARVFLKRAGIYSFVVARKPRLTPRHMKERLVFARAFRNFRWNRVVFSDEKIWRVTPHSKIRCWRKKGEKYIAKNVLPSTAISQSVMVWCGINGRGELILKRCPKKVKAVEYQNVLQSALHFIRPR